MFGVSLPELIVVCVVILIVFGPEKLPEIAKSLGRWTGDFRRTSDSLRREFYHSVYNPTVAARQELRGLGQKLLSEEPSSDPKGEKPQVEKPATPEQPPQEGKA